MPPLPTIPGAYYGFVQATCNGRLIHNVLCFQTDTPPATTTLDAAASGVVATAVASNWGTLATDLSVDYTATEAVFYPLGHPTLPAFVSTFSASGATSGAAAPAQTCALIHHQIYRRGKGTQSRTYIGGLPASGIDAAGQNLTTTLRANLQSDWAIMMNAILTTLNGSAYGTFDYVQLSKKGTGATYPVVSTNVELPLATQRRRVRP